jgi:hypothetical protein
MWWGGLSRLAVVYTWEKCLANVMNMTRNVCLKRGLQVHSLIHRGDARFEVYTTTNIQVEVFWTASQPRRPRFETWNEIFAIRSFRWKAVWKLIHLSTWEMSFSNIQVRRTLKVYVRKLQANSHHSCAFSCFCLIRCFDCKYDGVSTNFRTESITTTTATINTPWEATQRFMAAKLARLAHKIAVKLHLVAESPTICSSLFRRPVPELLATPSYGLLRCFIDCLQ